MKTIPFPQLCGKDSTLFSSKADNQALMCLYRETIQSGDAENDYVLYKTFGIQSVLTSPAGRYRGAFQLNDHVFAVIGSTIAEILGSLTLPDTSFGPIADDGKNVTFAADPDTLVVVSGGILYAIFSGTLMTPATPFTPLAVCSIDGYFFALSEFNQLFFSVDGLVWDPLDFQTVEGSPNNILTIIEDHNELWAVGNRICQVFTVGTDPDTPLVPRQDAIIPQGTAAPSSVVAANNALMWIGKNKNGERTVVQMNGFQPQSIATYAVENTLRGLVAVDDCIAMPFQLAGHEMVWFTFPAANRTICYDATEKDWYQVGSWNDTLGLWDRHRANCVVSAFGKILVGDHTNGKLYELSPDFYDDDGGTLRWLRRAPHLTKTNKNIKYGRLEVTAETGVGLDANPLVEPGVPAMDLEVVLEMGGRTWSSGAAGFTPNSSMMKLDADDYDGAVFYFEVCGSNAHATLDATAELIYDGSVAAASVTLTANTGVTRVRSTAFVPSSINKTYQLRLGANLNIYSARVIVVQTDATKTRLQFPLAFSQLLVATSDAFGFSSSNSTSYNQGDQPNNFSILPLDLSLLADIADGTPWTFETVAIPGSGTGQMGLFDKDTDTLIVENSHGPALLVTSIKTTEMAHSLMAPSDGHNLELRIKKGTGAVPTIAAHSAYLYVRLTNLTKAIAYRRVGPPRTAGAGAAAISNLRQLIDSSLYDNPAVFYEASGYESVAGVVTDGLADVGAVDVAGSAVLVADSSLTFDGTTKIVQRSGAVTVVDGDRFGEIPARTSGTLVLCGEYLIIVANSPIADVVSGAGLGGDPVIVLRISFDGGKTWSDSYARPIGKLGEYDTIIAWNRIGTGRDTVFELSGSDPVKIAITGANFDAEQLSS